MERLDPEDHRRFKDELYNEFARVGKALASPKRLELLDLLAQGQRTVQALADEMDASVQNTSQHLQNLQAANLVEARKEGTYRYYRLADENVFGLWQALRELASERLAEVDAIVEDYLGTRTALETPDPSQLADGLDDSVVLLDVRPAHEYEEGHLAGARSVPIDELEEKVDELPEDKQFLVYCRGPFCVYSDEAVSILREGGREAHRLDPGLPDWRSVGVPVVTESEEVDA